MPNERKSFEKPLKMSGFDISRVRADAGKALHHLLIRRQRIPWDHMVMMWKAALARGAMEETFDMREFEDDMPTDLAQSMGSLNISPQVAISFAISRAMEILNESDSDDNDSSSSDLKLLGDMFPDELIPWLTDESWRAEKWGSLEDMGFVRIQILDKDDALLGHVAESNEFVRSLISKSEDEDDNSDVGDWYAYFVDSLSFARQFYWMGTISNNVAEHEQESSSEGRKSSEFFHKMFGTGINAVSLADSIIHAEYDTANHDFATIELSYMLAKAAPEEMHNVIQALDIFFVQVPQRAYGKVTSKPTEPEYMERGGYLPCLATERAIGVIKGASETSANKSSYPSVADLLLARLYHMKARLLISNSFIPPWEVEAEEGDFESPPHFALDLLDKALAIYRSSEHSDSRKHLSPEELRIEIDRTVAQSLSSSISGHELEERYRFMEKAASDINNRELSDSIELNGYQFTLQGEDRMRVFTKFLEERSEESSEWIKLMCEFLISVDSEFAPSLLQRIKTLRQLEKLDPIRAFTLKQSIFTAPDGFPAHERLFKQLLLEVSTTNEEAKQGIRDGKGTYQIMPESFVEELYEQYLALVSVGICGDHNYQGKVSNRPGKLSYESTFGRFFGSRFDEASHQACARVLMTPSEEFAEVFGIGPDDHETRRTMMRFAGLALLLNSTESPDLESVEKFAGQDEEENFWDSVLSSVLRGRVNECYSIMMLNIGGKLHEVGGLRKGDGFEGHVLVPEMEIDEPTDALDYILLGLVDPGALLSDYDVDLQSLEEWNLWDSEHHDLSLVIGEDEVENYTTIMAQFGHLIEVVLSFEDEKLELQEAISKIGEIQESIKDLDTQDLVHAELLEEATDEAGMSKLQASVQWWLMGPSAKGNELIRLRHHMSHLLTFIPWARQWPADFLLAKAMSTAIRDILRQSRKMGHDGLLSRGLFQPILDVCSCMIYVTPDEDREFKMTGPLYDLPSISPAEYRNDLLWLEEFAELLMSKDLQPASTSDSEDDTSLLTNTIAYYYIAIKYRRFAVFEEDIFDKDLFRAINEIHLDLVAEAVSHMHGYSAPEIAMMLAQAIADRDDAEELISNIDLVAPTKFESEGPRFSKLILDEFESIRNHQ